MNTKITEIRFIGMTWKVSIIDSSRNPYGVVERERYLLIEQKETKAGIFLSLGDIHDPDFNEQDVFILPAGMFDHNDKLFRLMLEHFILNVSDYCSHVFFTWENFIEWCEKAGKKEMKVG